MVIENIVLTGQVLVSAWGTELLADSTLFGPMVLVALPGGVVRGQEGPYSYEHAETIQNRLYKQFNIEVYSYERHIVMNHFVHRIEVVLFQRQ